MKDRLESLWDVFLQPFSLVLISILLLQTPKLGIRNTHNDFLF